MLAYALSVGQPWAWAIIHGPKRFENRVWYTHYRGPILIHASLSKRRLGDHLDLERGTDCLPGLPEYDELAYGAIIGAVDLVDVVRPEDLPLCRLEPFVEGPWCFRLVNPRALAQPIRYRGRQKFFAVDLELPELRLDPPRVGFRGRGRRK